MRPGQILTRLSRWLARRLAGLAGRLETFAGTPNNTARIDAAVLAALAERFPGAPEHWLRAVAAHLPSAAAISAAVPSLSARPPARVAPARPALGPAFGPSPVPVRPVPHPTSPPPRVRPTDRPVASTQGPRRDGLLLPRRWPRFDAALAFLRPVGSRSVKAANDAAPDAREARSPISRLPAPPERREPPAEFEQWGSRSERYVTEIPQWPGLPATDRPAPAFLTGADQPRRADFMPIGDQASGCCAERPIMPKNSRWPALPAAPGDAEPWSLSPDEALLRLEQMVGRWSA